MRSRRAYASIPRLRSLRLLDRRAEDVLRSLELAAPREGIGELGQRLEPPRIVGRKEVDAMLQEAHGCGDVGTSSGTRAGREEPDRSTRAELVGVGLSELATVQIRLLEVVADDLVALDQSRASRASRRTARGARARVAFGSDSYAASRMSRWRKRKPSSSREGRGRRADELLAHERRQMRLDVGADRTRARVPRPPRDGTPHLRRSRAP